MGSDEQEKNVYTAKFKREKLGYAKWIDKLSGSYPVYSNSIYPARSVVVEDPNLYQCIGYEEEIVQVSVRCTLGVENALR